MGDALILVPALHSNAFGRHQVGLKPAVPGSCDLRLIMEERIPYVAFDDRLSLEACTCQGGGGNATKIAQDSGSFNDAARPRAGLMPVAIVPLAKIPFFVTADNSDNSPELMQSSESLRGRSVKRLILLTDDANSCRGGLGCGHEGKDRKRDERERFATSYRPGKKTYSDSKVAKDQ